MKRERQRARPNRDAVAAVAEAHLTQVHARNTRIRAELIERGIINPSTQTVGAYVLPTPETTTMPSAKTSTKLLKIADQIRAVGRGLFSLASFVRKFEGQIKSIGLTEQEHTELTTTAGYPSARHYNNNRLPGTKLEFGQTAMSGVRKEAVLAKVEKLAKQYDKIGQ